MTTIFKLSPFAFLVCLGLTPFFRNLFHRFEILDRPDVERKQHLKAVPRVGGIPLFLSYGLTILLFFFLDGKSAAYPVVRQLVWPIFPAGTLVFFAGVADDMYALRWRQKLLPQVIAAVMLVAGGVHVNVPSAGESLEHTAVRVIGLVLSVCWIIGCTNSINLIDGVDGLAAGVSFCTLGTCLVVGIATHDVTLVLMTAPLLASLAAFLFFNFAPASIFLGDCGSLTLGFMVGASTLLWSRHTNGPMRLLAPGIAVALPILDLCLSVCRRYLRETPIAGADRGHIHHKVMVETESAAKTSLTLYVVAAISGCLALSEHFDLIHPRGMTLAVAVILLIIGIKALNYVEFEAARQALSRKRVMGNVRDGILMTEMDGMLDAANSPDEVWFAVQQVCARMKLEAVAMTFVGVRFEASHPAPARRGTFEIRLEIGEDGELLLQSAERGHHTVSFSRIEQLQSALEKKCDVLMDTGKHATYPDERLLHHPALL